MYKYKCKVNRVIDGDTVDLEWIDLGFNILLRDQRVRLYGIDTPESRTSDPIEKQFGLAAKKRLEELLIGDVHLISNEYDARGKFGRILGDFHVDGMSVCDILVFEYYASPYFGGNKDLVEATHKENRIELLKSGKVILS